MKGKLESTAKAATPGPLPYRAEMEEAFGADFSDVTAVFGEGAGGRGSAGLPADAATNGKTVWFRTRNPTREQVGHELTHVVQRRRGGGSGASKKGDGSEREADALGPAAARGESVEVKGAASAEVHGDWWSDVVAGAKTLGHDVAEGVGLEDSFDANLGRADAFVDHGDYGPQDVSPGTGLGGFEACYHPGSNRLSVVMRVAVNFVDGLQVDGSGNINPAHANLQSVANAAAALAEPERSAFIVQYQWAAGDKGTWMTDLESGVESAWGGQYEFFVNKPQWEWIGASVSVDIQSGERTRAGDDHLALDSIKIPPNTAIGVGVINSGSSTNAKDQRGTVASEDVRPRSDNLLRLSSVRFAADSDVLDAAATAELDAWIATYQGAPANTASNPTRVVLEAHTSASGSERHNRDLSTRRAAAVSAYLSSHGFTQVSTRVRADIRGETGAGATENAGDRRVDLIVDGGGGQVVANHEFGHAFGLGDEYAVGTGSKITGTGATAGTPAAHNAQVQSMTDASGANLPGAIHENNGNIMSLGNAVRPQHYATFHEALRTVSGVQEWALGARQRSRPSRTDGLGDFPTPSGDTRYA